jgi:hypothetical protein
LVNFNVPPTKVFSKSTFFKVIGKNAVILRRNTPVRKMHAVALGQGAALGA